MTLVGSNYGTNQFHKALNPKLYQTLAHNKQSCSYIKVNMGMWGTMTYSWYHSLNKRYLLKPQNLKPYQSLADNIVAKVYIGNMGSNEI
jgi:hypothetical protein